MTITKISVAKEHSNDVFTDSNKTVGQHQETAFNKSAILARAIILGSLTIIALVTFSSCTRKAVFQISPIVPAARGYVKTKKDSNKNYNIYVSLEDLAEPNRLTPPKHAYVVWLATTDNITKNIGQVKTSKSFMSHTLKGSFETVSATKPVKIFITAEDDATVQSPSPMMVMTTDNF